MTQYHHTVGSTPQHVIGNLCWNSNGTLQKLDIPTDLNPSNIQTCNYSYDDLARVAAANCGNVWTQTFGYDPLGNLSKFLVTGYPGTAFTPTYSTSTNRITSSPFTYDANGNTLTDNVHTYAWDAEGKVITADSLTLTYDALGRMVEQNGTTQIVYAPTGQKFALMTGQTVAKAFVPLPGGAQAVYAGTTLAYFRHPGWLGSSRLTTTTSQTVYSSLSYAPFGETYAVSGTPDRSFTGQNQDTLANGTTGLYDFMYREYALYGRWISPDPAGVGAIDIGNPQSWNRYSYLTNNPLNATDPLGLDMCLVGGLCEETFAESNPQLGTGQVLMDGSAMNASVAGVALGTGLGVPGPAGWGFAKDSNGNVHGYFTYAGLDGNGGVVFYNVYGNGVNAPGEIGLPTVVGGVSTAAANNVNPWDRRADAVAVLRGKNDCSDWFNQGHGSAADIMSHVPILRGKPAPGPIPGPDAWTSPGPTTPIYVSPNGRFYPNSLSGRPVGGVFPPGSYGAQMIILFHELAHKVALIPSDAFSTLQSDKNTQTVMGHCAGAVK